MMRIPPPSSSESPSLAALVKVEDEAERTNPHRESNERAAAGLAAIMGKLQGLKPFPESAQRLLSLIMDPDHDTEKVVEIIESDPGLTAKVLRLINSGAFGLRRECESVQQSTVLLGSRQVAEVASAQLAMAQFDSTGAIGRKVRDHSLEVALLAKKLARGRSGIARLDVFTPAILHDLGKLLHLQADQGEYEEVLLKADGADELHELELSVFGYDHAMLAVHVMEAWKLPSTLCELVGLQNSLEEAKQRGARTAEAVALLQFCDRLQQALGDQPEGEAEQWLQLSQLPSAQHLEFTEQHIGAQWAGWLDCLS